MPQLVRDWRYCSHLEQGVEISESINLLYVSFASLTCLLKKQNIVLAYQWPPFTL